MPSPRRGKQRPDRPCGGACRRAAAAAILLAAALGPLASLAGPKEDLRELRTKVERLTRELAASESSRADATDALRESERAISGSSRRLFELQSRQEQTRARLEALEAEQTRLDSAVTAQQEALGRVLRHSYIHRQGSPAALLLAPGDPGQAARRLHYLGYVYRDRAAALERLRQDQEQVQSLRQEVLRQGEELAALEAEQLDAQRQLQQQRGERAKALARVSAQIERQRREIDGLKRSEQRLTRLVEKLARQLAARKPAKKKPQDTAAGRNKPGQPPAQARKGPEAAPVAPGPAPVGAPVRGELVARFGSPRSGTGLRWNGWFIAAAQGTPVKAPAPGRVVFADWLRGFGNLLILDHGEGLMTLYGNNDALLRTVGEEVQQGERIAAVGASGGGADSGLYFEVRFQGKPMDPARWIGSR